MSNPMELMTEQLSGAIEQPEEITGSMEYDVIAVVENSYDKLRNLPKVNDVELIGNKNSEELGVLDVDDQMSIQMINDAWDAIFN